MTIVMLTMAARLTMMSTGVWPFLNRSLTRNHDTWQNNAYRPDASGQDEIYLYGEMTFNTRQGWQLDDSSLTLMDHVADGKFATIYKATWQHDRKLETVAAKMLKRESAHSSCSTED